MTRSVSVLLVATALASCGGGNGGGRLIPLSNDTTGSTQKIDLIEYKTQYSGSFDDGFGSVDFELEGNTTISFEDLGDLVLGGNLKTGFTHTRIKTSFDADGQISAGTETIAHAADGSNYVLSFDNEDCQIDETTFDTVGAPLGAPGTFFIGFTYNQTFPMVCTGGEAATYTVQFSVLNTETVSTPLASIEAFKVSYSTQTRKTVRFLPDELYEQSGTTWVNPDIGVVKRTGTDSRQDRSGLYSLDFEMAIKSFN